MRVRASISTPSAVESMNFTSLRSTTEPLGRLGAALEQRLAHGVRVVEVELAGEADDDRAVAAVDSGDRILADPRCSVLSRSAALCHDSLLSWLAAAPPRRGRIQASRSSAANGLVCLLRMEVEEVAARAAGENFPVGSVLFPRALRPHVRALYCYARLVDELGDAYDGDRLAALDELSRRLRSRSRASRRGRCSGTCSRRCASSTCRASRSSG